MFSLFEISRFLLGPLGIILVTLGGFLGVCWGYFGHPLERVGSLWGPFGSILVSCWDPWLPLRSLWASYGLILEPLHSLWAPGGQLQVRFRVLLVILGSFLVHFRPNLCVLCLLCRYWQDFFAICLCVEFILSLQANWRFPSLAVQVLVAQRDPNGDVLEIILVTSGVW